MFKNATSITHDNIGCHLSFFEIILKWLSFGVSPMNSRSQPDDAKQSKSDNENTSSNANNFDDSPGDRWKKKHSNNIKNEATKSRLFKFNNSKIQNHLSASNDELCNS